MFRLTFAHRWLAEGGQEQDPMRLAGWRSREMIGRYGASACYILRERVEFAGSWWISDDREALRYAKFQGITARETIDLMSTAVVNGDVAARKASDLMQGCVTRADTSGCRRRRQTSADLDRIDGVGAGAYHREYRAQLCPRPLCARGG
ncbi:MAG: hypothetical protein ACRDQ7_02375 [Haloechinothrix sp.]